MNEIQEALHDIIAAIRGHFENLTQEELDAQSVILDRLGYPYNHDTYPHLDFPQDWTKLELLEDWGNLDAPDDQGHVNIPGSWGVLYMPEGGGGRAERGHPGATANRPPTLAEALLWKLGKWNSYVTFVQEFAAAPDAPFLGNRMVFQGFARHLRTMNWPIFDQHALRAMWAIRGNREGKVNWPACKAYLMNAKDVWDSHRPADSAVTSYTWYCDQIKQIKMAHVRPGMRAVDRLLMPLGKALKKNSADLEGIERIADW